MMLRRLLSLTAMLVLLLTAAPVMACVTDQAMSQSQDACCQMMHGKCGEMAKTGCCRVEIRDQEPQVVAHAPVMTFDQVVFVAVFFELPLRQVKVPERWPAPDEPSPPRPRSIRPHVLRL